VFNNKHFLEAIGLSLATPIGNSVATGGPQMLISLLTGSARRLKSIRCHDLTFTLVRDFSPARDK
jgi:hypothetical protein